jgi:hypothetical protein
MKTVKSCKKLLKKHRIMTILPTQADANLFCLTGLFRFPRSTSAALEFISRNIPSKNKEKQHACSLSTTGMDL